MIEAAKNAVLFYARSIILSGTEIIFALNYEGGIVMATSPLDLKPEEREEVLEILLLEDTGIFHLELGGKDRVFTAFNFTPFSWYMILIEEEAAFYQDADRIRFQTLAALGLTSALAVLTLVLLARHLTNPLERVVKAMNAISSGSDLSSRVEIEYRDETGTLAATFNSMLGELEKAYSQIKRYAFDAVLAGKKEQRIRQIFQKYVPKDVIDKCFAAKGSMLKIGEERNLTILFSDIRGFTAISERFKNKPEDLVESLNRYFTSQVDIIMNRNGIVDKYIGDAIMAFWGAPVNRDDDVLQSVLSALDMIDALQGFNDEQRKLGKPEFRIGIGINYGLATVGNIGSERKMDYTVIGDEVNLASRMDGLNKIYHTELLLSDSVYSRLPQRQLPGRLLDMVAVKGKKEGVRIFTVKRNVSVTEEKAWAYHNQGMLLYLPPKRDFVNAAKYFQAVLTLIPGDFNALNLLARCKAYSVKPPPPDWNGVEIMKNK